MTFRTPALAFVLAFAAAACSTSSSTGSADDALSVFENPTGSFTKESGKSAITGFNAERGESGKVGRPRPGSGTSSTQSALRLRTMDAQTQCNESQDCVCPGGGSYSWQSVSSKVGVAARVSFSQCVFDDGNGFDGSALAVVSKEPIIGLATKASDSYDNALFAAKGTAFQGTEKIELEFAALTEAGYTLVAVEVADGKIVVGVGPDGSLFVKAKQGSFECKHSASGYACTGDDGEEIDVEGSIEAPTADADF